MLPSIPNFPRDTNRSLWHKTSSPFKKLVDVELKAKIKKVLCFRCDAKISPGHRCKDKQLQVLLVHDEPYA